MVSTSSPSTASPPIRTGGGARRLPPSTLSMPVRRSASGDRSGVPVPASRDPISLPRPLTSADLMEPSGDGLKVAYQGCPGAYSEAAAKKAYPSCLTVPCEYFETAFQAVERFVADRAVLPLENSLGGSIHRNYDLLLRHRLHIVGEVRLAVRHCLLANRGVKIENLQSAMSHPQALAQCEQTLTKLGIEHREAVDDTAGAAKLIAEQKLQDTGAVASSLAAQLYGLDILAENIQDDTDNVTRFMMLAREPIIPRTDKPFKTSIVFSLEEGPGQLFKALAVFALRKINLTKMESRPHKKRPLRVADENCFAPLKHFDYLFYVDLEASMADPNAQNALGNLKEFATFLRVLGSYPTDGEPSFNLFGFIMCVGATAARALKTVLQGILMSSDGEKINSMNLLMYMAPIAVVLLAPATIFMEDNVVAITMELANKDLNIIWYLLVNSSLAYFVNLTNFLVTKHTSALTLQVLGNAKGAVAVVISILIFRNPVSVTGMLGYTLTVIGVLLYSDAKKRTNQ